MIHALLALSLLAQDPSTAPLVPPAESQPAKPAPAQPSEPPAPDAPPPEPAVTPPADGTSPAQPAVTPSPGDPAQPEPGAPAVPPGEDEYEDIPPPFAAGPAAVGSGATTLGFVTGGLVCSAGAACCMVPLVLVPLAFLAIPCVPCLPWAGAGLGAAAGSTLGGLWEFFAGNKGPLVWARLAAPPAVGMALMLPGVLLGMALSVVGVGALLFVAPDTTGVLVGGASWLAAAALVTVGLLVGATGAMATYAGLVVFDSRGKE